MTHWAKLTDVTNANVIKISRQDQSWVNGTRDGLVMNEKSVIIIDKFNIYAL